MPLRIYHFTPPVKGQKGEKNMDIFGIVVSVVSIVVNSVLIVLLCRSIARDIHNNKEGDKK